jgi:hypothetical protein
MKSKPTSPLLLLALTAGIAVLCVGGAASPAEAGVHVGVHVGIPLPPIPVPVVPVPVVRVPVPPPLVFPAPPELVILPGSSVYVAPDFGEDLYYVDGWWWRPYQGHWYRSHYYDRDWGAYNSVPHFYSGVPHDWRHRYQEGQWGGQPWHYERVHHDHLPKGGKPHSYKAAPSKGHGGGSSSHGKGHGK